VEDVAEGHWLAFQQGRSGERYILGGRNMTLKELLEAVAAATDRSAPRIRVPHILALTAGYLENAFSTISGREPRIPLEGVRMARHKAFVNCSRATRELGFHPGSVADALGRAAHWYIANGYVPHLRPGVAEVA